MSVSSLNRILIVKLSSFGDVVQTLPLLHLIRQAFPNATIGWAVQKAFAPLIDGHPLIDNIHILPAKKLSPCLALGKELQAVGYDVVLDAQGLFVSGLVAYLSKAPRRIGYNWRREANHLFLTDSSIEATDRVHMVEKILRLGDAIGIQRLPFTCDSFLSGKESKLLTASPSTKYASLVVGASVQAKTLSTEHWARVAVQLNDFGFVPILIGGTQEVSVAESIQHLCSCPVMNFAGKTPFPELAAVLSQSSVVISSDTGALHLGVAVGTPTVGLFGVTDPVRTGNGWGQAASVILDAGGDVEGRNFRNVSPDSRVVDTLNTSDIVGAALRIARCTK